MIAAETIQAYRFFGEWAGYRAGHRAEGALELARAEALLEDAQGLSVAFSNVEPDPEGTTEGAAAVGVVVGVYQVGDTTPSDVASLWGIEEDAPMEHLRVVRAELASELIDSLRQAIGDARDAADEVDPENPYGRCDECGSPCDSHGCVRDRAHAIARCACGRELDAGGEHGGGYGAFCG